MKIDINTILLVALILLVFFVSKPKDNPAPIIINQYDSTEHITNYYAPKPVQTIQVPVPADVDTAAILQKHFSISEYNDTISDSCITINIRDSVGFNRILNRRVSHKWTCPTSTTVITQEPQRIKAYVGGMAWVDTNKVRIGINLTLINKNDWMITGGKSLNSKEWNVGIAKKISIKKPRIATGLTNH